MLKWLSCLTGLMSMMSFAQVNTVTNVNNFSRVTISHIVKSNYTYHSGWVECDFDDTVVMTTIYQQVDKLLLVQAKTGIKKNITFDKILWRIEPNDYVEFSNYEPILDDVEQYVSAGNVDSSYYSALHLYGNEQYSWDWGHACPAYTWTWTYAKRDGTKENLFSYNNYGYGNADHSIFFHFAISYDEANW